MVTKGLLANKETFLHLVPIEITNQESGLDGIDCIYVINLKEREDRWLLMEERLSKQYLQANRIKAVNGWQFSQRLIKKMKGRYGSKMSGGAIGCALSHISIWKDAIERDFERIWVMEDDIEFVEEVSVLMPLLDRLEVIDPAWDILYTDPHFIGGGEGFGIICSHPSVPIKNAEYYRKKYIVDDDLMRINGRWGTYSMILSRSGILKLFRAHGVADLWAPIDHTIHHVPTLREYSLRRPLVTHLRESESNTNQAPIK